jgi:serine/threonine protein kinase
VDGVAPDSPEAAEILDARDRDRRRFLREIRVTARLEHPGTPAVYDTGVETGPDGTSRVWLVMQLLRGSTVEALLDRADFSAAAHASGTAPTVSWAAAITAQIAAVLADVHRVDIVHRDIKPSNVMVTEGGLVKVLDFGIAILQGASALPRLTQVDRTIGTPPYMSPEQCLGQLRVGIDAAAGAPPADPAAIGAETTGRGTGGDRRAGDVDAGEGPCRTAQRRGRVRGAAAVRAGLAGRRTHGRGRGRS